MVLLGNICLKHNYMEKKFVRGSNFNYTAVAITTSGRQFLNSTTKVLEEPNEKICSFLKTKA